MRFLKVIFCEHQNLSAFGICIIGFFVLFPCIDTAARFTQFPPDVLYVSRGGTARFVWDYTVDNRKLEFFAESPQWLFYDQDSNKESLIGSDDRYTNNWDFVINTATCPPRLLNPTRVSRESPATLVISNVTTADIGIYRCALVLKAGNPIIHRAHLIVTVPPSFSPSGPDKNYKINKYQDLKINCSAIGPPTPNITWVRIRDGFVESRGAGSAVLNINNINRHQSGIYECQARNNPNENATTTQTNVIVNYKPIISKEFSTKNLSSWNGKILKLKCIAHGLPTPNITWYKPGGQQITSGVTNVNNGSHVTITTKECLDYGFYKCRASNAAGRDEHLISVTQLFAPDPVKLSVTDIEASSITVRWLKSQALNSESPVISYLLAINTKQPISTVKTYAVITALKKNTKYTVKVYAENNVGYGMASVKVFTTKKQGKPSIPLLSATLYRTSGSPTSVSLKWSKPDDNGEIITKYTIYMKGVTSQSDWTKIKDVLELFNLEYTITKNIEIGKTYKFIVTAWNKYGESIKDDWNAKTVNTTADKATHTNEKAVSCCTQQASKFSSTVVGVIIAILIISLGLNILLVFLFLRKVKLNGEKENKNSQLRKTQHKMTKDEIYENDLEMEDTATLAVVTESDTQQSSRHQIPEYETIQRLNEEAKHQATPFTSSGPRHYQELNLQPSSLSKQEGQRTPYEPLRTTSMKPRTTQQNDDVPQPSYEPLGLRNQSSDYQSLQTNNRESVI